MKLQAEDIENFIHSIRITNYSIYAPILLIILSLGLLVLLLFRRNKFTYTLLILLIFLDLFSMGHFLDENRKASYIYNRIEESDDLSFLKDDNELFRVYPLSREISEFRLYPNMNFYNEIEIISGYGPLILKDYKYITELQNDPGWTTDWKKFLANNNIISFLNTKYIILARPEDLSGTLNEIGQNNYSVAYDNGSEIVLENNNYLPRFFFVNNIIEADDLREVKEIIWEEKGNDFNPETTATVEGIDFENKYFADKDAVINISEYKRNKVILETESYSNNFLVFSDNYYPGWKAYIDNEPAKIYRVNGIIKGIYLSEGPHQVIFSYYPTYFKLSIILSSITLLICIISIILLYIFRRKR